MRKGKRKERKRNHMPAITGKIVDTPIADILLKAVHGMKEAIHKHSQHNLTKHIKDINNLAQLIKKLESCHPKNGLLEHLNYPTIGAFMHTIMLNTFINEVIDNKKIALYLDIEPAATHIRNTILFTDNDHSTTGTFLDNHLLFTLIIQKGYVLDQKGLSTPDGKEILPMWLMKAISPTMDDIMRLLDITTAKKTKHAPTGPSPTKTTKRRKAKKDRRMPLNSQPQPPVKPKDGRRRRTTEKKATSATFGQQKARRKSHTRKGKKAV